jgi:hypothetical protein
MFRFALDTKADIIFIYGAPRREYNALIKVCRICWIYEFEWDDDNMSEFVSYSNVDDAIERCTKYEHNVCGTEEWLSHLEKNKSTLCMLEDTIGLDTRSNSYEYIDLDKFAVCTNDSQHKFVTETHGHTVLLDTRNSVITQVNNTLCNPVEVPFKYIISSSSFAPYILSRLLMVPS